MRPKVTPNACFEIRPGFALVEVLVSAVLVVIMAAGTMIAIQSTQRTSAEERHRATAHGIAQEDQARMRAFRISSLANYNETRPVAADDGTYTVNSRADFVTDSTGTASCEQNTAAADYIRISSTVSWPSIGAGPRSYPVHRRAAERSDRREPGSPRDRGQGRRGPADSEHRAQRHGRGSFSGDDERERLRDLRQLPAGNYTLTTNAPGYVEEGRSPPGSVSTSVVALSTNTLALQYDEPGAAESRSRPWRAASSFSRGRVRGRLQHRHDRRADFSASGPASVLTAEPLFPFSSPDTVYAGVMRGQQSQPRKRSRRARGGCAGERPDHPRGGI